jgi:hypothetical protein
MSSLIDVFSNLLHAWTCWSLVPHHKFTCMDPAEEEEYDDVDAPLRRRLARIRQGMGGNGRRHHQNPKLDNDPYAKIKFYIPSFNGSYDANVTP